MRLTQDDRGLNFVIRSFSESHVTVNDQQLQQSFLLTPENLESEIPVEDLDDLEKHGESLLLRDDPEVVLIGTGSRTRMGPSALSALLMRQGVGIEYMDTAAALRTYTVLASELRRVSLLVIFQ
ncbi:MTH938/NDUFAF3 family protein [Guyparkeria hydrothermalis]|uniref:Mth938-like domain-containing protein n=1 Tax=Guyparkeria hydrothermalis TaxID=923 RepID=UPI00202106AA|nr:MTH938/NDUFAF3 family protein [Guyparkeria hydrothermalis]MCL7743866.1 MTH938/NDUFAF3 family protein [Guyparkeria hydrothermalis]